MSKYNYRNFNVKFLEVEDLVLEDMKLFGFEIHGQMEIMDDELVY